MKLREPIQRINADFLENIKAAMSIELTRTPIIMTFEQALMMFRNIINRNTHIRYSQYKVKKSK